MFKLYSFDLIEKLFCNGQLHNQEVKIFGMVPSLLIVPQLKLNTSCFRNYNQFFNNLPTSKGVLSLLVNFTNYNNILEIIVTCIRRICSCKNIMYWIIFDVLSVSGSMLFDFKSMHVPLSQQIYVLPNEGVIIDLC